MGRIYEKKRSLIDYTVGIVAFILLGSTLVLFLAKWLHLHRQFEDGAYIGIYVSGGLFGLFLLFSFVSVLVAQVAKLFRGRGVPRQQ